MAAMASHADAPAELEAVPVTPPPRADAAPSAESSAKVVQTQKPAPKEKASKAVQLKRGSLRAKAKGKAAKAKDKVVPAAPKGPKTAYMLWSAENRQRVVQEQGASGFAEAARALAKAWAGLSAEEKAPFVERQRELSAQHAEAKLAHEKLSGKAGAAGKGRKAMGKKGKKKKTETDERGFEVVWTKHGERKYRGVAHKEEGKGGWLASLSRKGKTIYIGRYATPEIAAAAYKACKQALAKRASPEDAKKAGQEAAATATAGGATKPAEAPAPAPLTESAPKHASEPELSKKRRPSKGGAPPPKRAKSGGSASTTAVTIDNETLGLAERLGLAGALSNLAQRPQVQGFSPKEMLDSLQACGGLVNPAKERLLQNRAQTAGA